jgi:hypothetical protein
VAHRAVLATGPSASFSFRQATPADDPGTAPGLPRGGPHGGARGGAIPQMEQYLAAPGAAGAARIASCWRTRQQGVTVLRRSSNRLEAVFPRQGIVGPIAVGLLAGTPSSGYPHLGDSNLRVTRR